MNEETKFKRKVLKFLKELPGKKWVYKTSDKYQVGIPDIFLVYDCIFIAIELKVNTNPLSDIQLFTLKEITKAGGKSCILHPANFEEFKKDILDIHEWGQWHPGKY